MHDLIRYIRLSLYNLKEKKSNLLAYTMLNVRKRNYN